MFDSSSYTYLGIDFARNGAWDVHLKRALDNGNNTQKAAIASPPLATHPQLWAELRIHDIVHVSIRECTLSHLHLHPYACTFTHITRSNRYSHA